jgi:uncharacterized delta-60 repeat protein
MGTARRIAVSSFCWLLLVSIPSDVAWAASSRSGRLDPSFGDRGTVLTRFSRGSFEAANALAVQSDGKIVAAGFSTTTPIPDFGLVRYGSKGDLDGRFGVHGKILTDFKGSGSVDVASGVAIQLDGKIVAAGYSDASGSPDFALARYNPNRTLDTTFNSSGKVLTDLRGSSSVDVASGVSIQPDGKIVAAGYSDASGSYDFALARYNSNGTLDTTFNSTGKVLTDFSGSGSGDFASAVAIQSDGKIVAAGFSDASGTPYDFGLARYNTNGTLDPTFHSSGKVLTDFSGSGSYDQAHALVIQSGGKIIAAGLSIASGNSDFAIARYNPNGTLDITFNSTGQVLTDLDGSGSQDEASAVVIQSDGKIVAAGDSIAGGGDSDFALARYKPDGTLDGTFNSTGRVLTNFGGFDVAYAVAIQSARRIVAAGFSDVSGSSDFALAGYLS